MRMRGFEDREDIKVFSTKTYVHAVGLSACFRQHRATSHCRFLHGYALEVRVEFEGLEVDERNWVVDFGALKSFRAMLEDTFDHKTLVAYDDPLRDQFVQLSHLGLVQLVLVPATGCESFSRLIFEAAEIWLKDNGFSHAKVTSVEVREHAGNSAITRAA